MGEVELAGKRVLIREDLNVPIADGEVTSDVRIRAALPTLKWLVEQGANVTACSHLGRPKGKPNPEFSMEPVRAHLATLAPNVKLLENLRFNPGETGQTVAGEVLPFDDRAVAQAAVAALSGGAG